MITLRPVDRENWVACSRLSLGEGQEGLVASNLATIAQSRFEPHFHLRAIYHEDSLVGMLAYCHEDDPEDLELYWIFRLMVDGVCQGKGYGSAAVKAAVDEMEGLGATRVRTMHKPENAVASSLYGKLGFERTGEVLDDGDIVLELNLAPDPDREMRKGKGGA
ncbi:MAG: GNAT family N-acetyltransferase [Verrucomicrobiae bacterium]|nr:GNAT family N-acetyltransferase [Verrucomicrobiae bacterium]